MKSAPAIEAPGDDHERDQPEQKRTFAAAREVYVDLVGHVPPPSFRARIAAATSVRATNPPWKSLR
jgi:hypothetical protein